MSWGKAIVVKLALAAAGCTAVVDASRPDLATTQYFGWVRIVAPDPERQPDSPVVSVEARAVGLRIENGVGLGYFHDRRLVIPLDCRIVIIARNQAELDHALAVVDQLEQPVCVTPQS